MTITFTDGWKKAYPVGSVIKVFEDDSASVFDTRSNEIIDFIHPASTIAEVSA